MLYIGPRDSTPAQVILRSHCGWVIDCGDYGALTGLLRHLAANREEIFSAGRNARKVFEENYDISSGTQRICQAVFGDAPVTQAVPHAGKPETLSGLDSVYFSMDKKP